jgi:hypothetical protein
MRKATDELGQLIQKVGAAMYQQPEQPQGGANPGEQPGGGQQPGGDDVVEGEFKEQ